MPRPTPTFARFLVLPENRAAWIAAQDLVQGIVLDRIEALPQPLFLHGSPGTGKSHLASALANEIAQQRPEVIVGQTPASHLNPAVMARTASVQGALFEPADSADEVPDLLGALAASDVVIVEDIQQLAPG